MKCISRERVMVVTPNAEKVVKVRINREVSIVAAKLYEEQPIRLLDSQYLRYLVCYMAEVHGKWPMAA